MKQSACPPKPEPTAVYPSTLDLLLEWLREFQLEPTPSLQYRAAACMA
ncbi:MAG: hypothetical protein WAV07_05890 [Candidatus Contendobacter sp.]